MSFKIVCELVQINYTFYADKTFTIMRKIPFTMSVYLSLDWAEKVLILAFQILNRTKTKLLKRKNVKERKFTSILLY